MLDTSAIPMSSYGVPVFKWPYSFPANIAQPGSQFFDLAAEMHFKDPIVEEWDLTLGTRVWVKASGCAFPTTETMATTFQRQQSDQPPVNTAGFNQRRRTTPPFPSADVLYCYHGLSRLCQLQCWDHRGQQARRKLPIRSLLHLYARSYRYQWSHRHPLQSLVRQRIWLYAIDPYAPGTRLRQHSICAAQSFSGVVSVSAAVWKRADIPE